MVEMNPGDDIIEASHCHHAGFDKKYVNESGTEVSCTAGREITVCRLCHSECQVVKLLVEEK